MGGGFGFLGGGFGFLAGRLAQYFSHKGHEIILGSRSQTDSPLWLKKAQVVQVKWNDPNNLRDICKNIDNVTADRELPRIMKNETQSDNLEPPSEPSPSEPFVPESSSQEDCVLVF